MWGSDRHAWSFAGWQQEQTGERWGWLCWCQCMGFCSAKMSAVSPAVGDPKRSFCPPRSTLPAGQQLSKQSRADGMILPGWGASGMVTRRGGAVSTGWAPADGWQGEAS